MNLYLPNGYFDFQSVMDSGYPYTFVVGGRGTGKTYGALETVLQRGKTFALMRRRQAQTDVINVPEFSPLKAVLRDHPEMHIAQSPIARGMVGYYKAGEDDRPSGEPIGYTCALSTLSNVRGFDSSRVEVLIYDEFIAEKGERALKNEADTLLNAYETINRNRELDGRPPLQLFGLANANDIANPVFLKLGIVQAVEKMIERGKEVWQSPARGLQVIALRRSPISAQKAATSLYRLVGEDSDFQQMAIGNSFAYETRGRIESRSLAEFDPLATVGDITIYSHKSERLYYVSPHRRGNPPTYGRSSLETSRFRRDFPFLYSAAMLDRIIYESYVCQIVFLTYIGIKNS